MSNREEKEARRAEYRREVGAMYKQMSEAVLQMERREPAFLKARLQKRATSLLARFWGLLHFCKSADSAVIRGDYDKIFVAAAMVWPALYIASRFQDRDKRLGAKEELLDMLSAELATIEIPLVEYLCQRAMHALETNGDEGREGRKGSLSATPVGALDHFIFGEMPPASGAASEESEAADDAAESEGEQPAADAIGEEGVDQMDVTPDESASQTSEEKSEESEESEENEEETEALRGSAGEAEAGRAEAEKSDGLDKLFPGIKMYARLFAEAAMIEIIEANAHRLTTHDANECIATLCSSVSWHQFGIAVQNCSDAKEERMKHLMALKFRQKTDEIVDLLADVKLGPNRETSEDERGKKKRRCEKIES